MNPYLLDRLEEMNPSGRSGTWEIQNDQSLKEVVPPSQEELDNYKKYYLASIDKQLPFETILRSDLQDKKIDEERFDKFIKIYNQQQKLQKQYNQELKDQALFDLGSRLSGDIPRYTEENPARLAKGGALRTAGGLLKGDPPRRIVTSPDNEPTMADFLATTAAGVVPGALLVYGADRYGKRMSETPQRISPEDQELINTRIEELLMADPVNEMRATTPDMFQRQEQAIESFLSGIGQFADEKNIPFLRALADPRDARDIAETISTGVDFSPAGIPTAVAEGFRMMGDDQPLMGAGMVALGVSPFKGMPQYKLINLLKKADEKLDNLRTRLYQAKSKMKPGLSKADFDEGWTESIKIQEDINKTTAEMDEMMEALYPNLANRKGYHQLGNRVPEKFAKKFDIDPMSPTAVDDYIKSAKLESVPVPEKQLASYPGDRTTFYFDPSTGQAFKRIITAGANDKLVSYTNNKLLPKYVKEAMARKNIKAVPPKTPKQLKIKEKPTQAQFLITKQAQDALNWSLRAGEPKQVKGIINATPETKKLYQEILDSPSRINTRDHQKVGKETSEQLREINKRIQEADLEDRNEVLRLLARLKDKKSK